MKFFDLLQEKFPRVHDAFLSTIPPARVADLVGVEVPDEVRLRMDRALAVLTPEKFEQVCDAVIDFVCTTHATFRMLLDRLGPEVVLALVAPIDLFRKEKLGEVLSQEEIERLNSTGEVSAKKTVH